MLSHSCRLNLPLNRAPPILQSVPMPAGASHTQSGTTLFEVMIALLILSAGLLGLATLQTQALRATETARLQYQAVQLAQDMAERLRSNPGSARAGEYSVTQGRLPATGSGFARTDLQDWLARLALLPAARADISACSSACPAPGALVITLYWNAQRDPSVSGYNCPPLSALDHRCFRLLVQDHA